MTPPIWTEAGRTARLAEIDQHQARRADLREHYGVPEPFAASAALELARRSLVPVAAGVTAGVVYAGIFRDDMAAEAWLDSDLENHGYPTLARFPLPDGRVVGILDLRPALERARRDVAEEGQR